MELVVRKFLTQTLTGVMIDLEYQSIYFLGKKQSICV